ncbi:MAG: ROK family protein [Planctomycetes bacterium]|nr:ROK family protein [Planctomycetota bacterium]
MAKKTVSRLFGGIDVGATKILALVADERGNIISVAKKKTKGDVGFKAVCERVLTVIREAADMENLSLEQLSAIGIGVPVPVSLDGVTPGASNLPGWKNAQLVKTMETLSGRPCFAQNDCNLGTYGEYIYGVGRNAKTLIGLFVGTGLGGGIVIDGQMLVGENNLAAELGHIIVQEGGRICGCGHKGCLEAYASKTGMARGIAWEIFFQGKESLLTQIVPENNFATIKASFLQEAYRKGDPVTVDALHELAHYLGVGIANYITIFGPDMVCIGGGVFEALGRELLPKVKESARRRVFPEPSYRDTKISLTQLGDYSVCLGAIAYAKGRLDKETVK